MIDEFLKETSKYNSVLQIGCGDCSFLNKVKCGIKVGIDSFRPILYSGKTNTNILINSDLQKFSLEDLFLENTFDTIIGIDILEYLNKDIAYRLINQCEIIARKQVFFCIPFGNHHQEINVNGLSRGNDYYQTYRSTWFEADLKIIDYEVKYIKDYQRQLGNLNGSLFCQKFLTEEKVTSFISPKTIAGNKSKFSIVTVNRNDDYRMNNIQRMVDFFDSVLMAFSNYDTELICVDWNIIPGKIKLCEEKKLKKYPVRWINVPNDLHNKYTNKPYMDVLEWYAKNVGIRRSSGEWVLVTNSDIIFKDPFPNKALDEKCIYLATRIDTEKSSPKVRKEASIINSPGNFILGTKRFWDYIKGFREIDRYSSMDLLLMEEAVTRYKYRVSYMKEYEIYHEIHEHEKKNLDAKKKSIVVDRERRNMLHNNMGKNIRWGLIDENLQEVLTSV